MDNKLSRKYGKSAYIAGSGRERTLAENYSGLLNGAVGQRMWEDVFRSTYSRSYVDMVLVNAGI